MKTMRIESRRGFPLTTALREIVGKLKADDWARWATRDDSSFYYVVGMKAHSAEEQEGLEHLSLSVLGWTPVSVVAEQHVHAQVASRRAGDHYVRQARNRLEASGIQPSQVDQFLHSVEKGDFEVSGWNLNEPGTDRLDAFINFVHALAIRRGVEADTLTTDADKARELDIAVQKLYLDELSSLFEAVVKRAATLEALDFDDQHLNEASRCYLYGFFKAAVVLSSTAVETCLRDAVGQLGLDRVDKGVAARQGGFYDLLIEESVEQGALGPRLRIGEKPVLASYSREIFTRRNDVAHKGLAPTSAQAEEVVVKARQVVEFVRRRRTS